MSLLLDTCTFIWLTSEPSRISKKAVDAIGGARDLYLSDVSIWEVCLKWQAAKIELPMPPRRWFGKQIQLWRVSPVAMSTSDMYRVTELPQHHKDPFDRLLVAQAIERDLSIVTPDRAIRPYPVACVW